MAGGGAQEVTDKPGCGNKTIEEGLKPPIKMTLECAIEDIEPDEYVEATPSFIRLRKRVLCPHERKQKDRALAES